MGSIYSIDGLSSGLNTTEIIDALIKAERQPAVLMENQQAEKTSIITALKALQAKLLALSTTASSLSMSAAFNAYSINNSDDSYLTATVDGKVSAGSFDIQVKSVARNHQIASQGISDQSLAVFGAGTITLSVGGRSSKTITIDSGNNSMVGIARAINEAKAGVTASIINDGSASNPYRLVLTADKTGASNKISITSNLTGLTNLNFTTSVFDAPETISKNSASTSKVSLGSTASFTGSKNKVYTFTVAGTGAKTIGSDNITLNWSDGTNSGSILVSQADAEVALVGTGAEGLKLSLSAGVLYGGDSFQVATFAPLLQEASNAAITIGSSGGNGSPITVTSETNKIKNVIGGLIIDVKKVTESDTSVNLTTDIDTAAIKDKIKEFITQYNNINDFINDQNSYDKETKESGVLFGEYTLQTMQSSMRSLLSSRLSGITSEYNQLATLGIRTGSDGNLSIKDSAKLETALREDLNAVMNVFTSSGSSSTDNIRFISSSSKTKTARKFSVDITQAATKGQFAGGALSNLTISPLVISGSNNKLKLSIDGIESNEIVLTEKTYLSPEDLVAELQDKIDNDTKIGSRGMVVSWEATSSGMGRLLLTSSSYGSKSNVKVITSVANSAVTTLGLATGISKAGNDVAGRINGEAATGVGQILTGNEKNATTEGLKLQITFGQSDLIDGTDGTITLAKGVASKMNDLVSNLNASGTGLMDSRIKAYQNQVNDLKERITDFDARLVTRREALQRQFYAMEQAMSNYNSIGTYLTNQLTSMNNNWSFNNNN